ncbi:multiple inositol polyphosphate phosphatase 1-like [Haliotis cracherodii]|uniref:multiple inositol polyphosphate phosphatase 1-like n=1 Tax=Haliotis cracherodii TaxID=6455 RepID=UPI0039ECDBEE
MSAAMKLSISPGRVNFLVISLLVPLHLSLTTASIQRYFGSKTAYELIHPPPEIVIEDEFNSVQVGTFSCLAAHSSAVMRHGARYPGLEDVETISKIHNEIKDKLTIDKFQQLKEWTNSFPRNDDKILMALGEDEHIHLGQRTARRLRSLFVDEDVENFRFLVSSKQRTQESGNAYYEGFLQALMGDTEEGDMDSELSDETLRFHERCQKYIRTVDKNETAIKEFYKFRSGKEMTNILKKVSSKLGIPENLLKTENLRTMYLVCGYETALYQSSPWCSLFDEEDFKVLEYLSDLKHYYKNGPGHKITGVQSCPLVTDIFTTMDDAIEAMETEVDEEDLNGYILGNFYFGHAETLGPLYTALGLFNDTLPPTADNYQQQSSRLFRTSEILPFSANLMLILYECDQNDELLTESEAADETRETSQYMLRLYVNEKLMKIPGCEDFTCLYSHVRKRFVDLISCNFSQVCDHNDRPRDEL